MKELVEDDEVWANSEIIEKEDDIWTKRGKGGLEKEEKSGNEVRK